MPKKKNTPDFSTQRNILNFRPNIHFVEPPQVEEDSHIQIATQSGLDQVKADVEDLLTQYATIADQADAIQAEIDKSAADVVINLDPAQDAAIIACVQRHFGDPNKTTITYQDYMDCLNETNAEGAAAMPMVDPNEVVAAATDQYRDIFGSLGEPSGFGRPELSKDNQPVKPLNMVKFQVETIEKLLEMLTSGIEKIALKKAKEVIGL